MVIHNAKIITPYRLIHNGSVRIKDGLIQEVFEGEIGISVGEETIDAQGNYLSPGFIDLHVHGGGGYDFMDANEQSFAGITDCHARYGTTAMMPTSLTSDADQMEKLLGTYADFVRNQSKGVRLLGMHLEGPYFAMSQRGAQDPAFIRNPDESEYLPLLKKYGHVISRWSAAPELPGALLFGSRLTDFGIIPSLAHTDAVYEEILKGMESGFTLATHLYSGMSGMTRKNAYRYAGAIESCLLLDQITVELIADGIHLPEPFLKLIVKTKGVDKIILVTDAMRAAGTLLTESILGDSKHGIRVIIEQGVAKLPDRSSFAGSIATANQLIRTMVNVAGVSLIEAVQMITINPARIVKRDHEIGSIAVGKKADLVLFDEQIDVKLTMVEGCIIFS